MNKNKLIESQTKWGAYGLMCDEAIINHHKYGLIYITECFYDRYSWEYGMAVKLQPGDTLDSLCETAETRGMHSVKERMMEGYDDDRPILDLHGESIEKIARSVNL